MAIGFVYPTLYLSLDGEMVDLGKLTLELKLSQNHGQFVLGVDLNEVRADIREVFVQNQKQHKGEETT